MTASGGIEDGDSPGKASGSAFLHNNNSLYISDLDKQVSEPHIYAIFSKVGPLASVRVCRDAVTGQSLCYGYVNYDASLDPEAAERALEELNYVELMGKPLRVMKSCRNPALRASGKGNVRVNNLDRSIGHKALHEAFVSFGSILSCKVMTDEEGRSKGYGFVHFEEEAAANLAISKVKLLNGVSVSVVPWGRAAGRPSQPDREVASAPERPPQGFHNVYVKNIANSMSEEDLRKLFSEFGPISSVVIMKEGGVSKGFGFVDFRDPGGAARAVDTLGGTLVAGKKLFCSPAQKKAERQAELNKTMGFKLRPNVWRRPVDSPVPPLPRSVPPLNQPPRPAPRSVSPVKSEAPPGGAIAPPPAPADKPENGMGSPHPSLEDLPQDLMEILNLAPEDPTPQLHPNDPNPKTQEPLEPSGGDISLSSSPVKGDSPPKQYSRFQSRTQILNSPIKPRGLPKTPTPLRGGIPNGRGDSTPPNSPTEPPSDFSLFAHGSLQSVKSAKILAGYVCDAEKAAEESGGAETEGTEGVGDDKLAAKEVERMAEPKEEEEFTFPTLDPAIYPKVSWT